MEFVYRSLLHAEWHPTKNLTSKLSEYTGSLTGQKIWWKCDSHGHEWEMDLYSRHKGGQNCPYCSNRKLLSGFNDLLTKHPDIAARWHPTKNGTLKPEEVAPTTTQKVWWLCDKGHEWETSVRTATRQGKPTCAVCTGRLVQTGVNDLASKHPQIAKEWHPTKNSNLLPTQVTARSHTKVWWLGTCGHEWEAQIGNRTAQHQGCPYCAGNRVLEGFNDLATTHPHLASQWHPTKNGVLKPAQVSFGAKKKVWWLGSCDHEWEATVLNRALQEQNCPYCAGKKVLSGFNDLATKNPVLASQWHPTKNGVLKPSEITANSGKKVWWQCEKNHEWEENPNSRSRGFGCPYCAGKRTQPGSNDLETLHPDIAAQWHPNKNGALKPSQFTKGSRQRIWWICEKNHEWEVSIASRTFGYGCPVCSNQKVLLGFNDLASGSPELAAEWHPTKNGSLSPEEFTTGSTKKVWWKCSKGHEWEARISVRRKGTGCPVCTGRQVMPGFNDVLTTHPYLLDQWHPTKNNVDLSQLSYGSMKPVWWLCDKNHEWEVAVNQRVFHKTNCPTCFSTASQMEKAIADYINELVPGEVKRNVKLLRRKEVDIYIPSKQVAVEFNGLYWHTEAQGKHRTYHYDKWVACKEQGVQLIQVWEDEWKRNPEQVKRMLAHKLGVSQERKVFARKTKLSLVDKQNAEKFLNQNHVQGYASGTYYLGLSDNDKEELVAVLVLKKKPGTDGKALNIIRYATSCNVVGGFTKLLKFAELTYQPESFITFADHGVSDGGLYEKNGFIADKELPPDYMYVVDGVRKHKFGYRLKKFRDDPNLLWEEGLTERELATLNKIPRVWDAGKTRYIKKL